jgi:hypothetical protein
MFFTFPNPNHPATTPVESLEESINIQPRVIRESKNTDPRLRPARSAEAGLGKTIKEYD